MQFAVSLLSQSATAFGFMAAAIAVFGFLAHAPRALTGGDERSLREATVRGGLGGFAVSLAIVVLSVLGVL